MNIFMAKPNATYEFDMERHDSTEGKKDCEDTDEFCGFPHLPSDVQLAVINWGEFYGD